MKTAEEIAEAIAIEYGSDRHAVCEVVALKHVTPICNTIKALQEALREAIGVMDGFGIDGEGLPRLRAILEESEK